MIRKNELKNLIYIQDNKLCDEQTIKGLFRSIVEPILEANVESLVLLRLEDKRQHDFNSLLKRLEYSNSKVYDFSKECINDKFENVLKESLWEKTEFIYVLAERFAAVLIFDFEESEVENNARIYLMHNSKNLIQSFELINKNSKVDLSSFTEKWHPDRRDNDLLNSSIKKIVEILNDTNQEIQISEIEKETALSSDDVSAQLNFLQTKSSVAAHEMRNLLSICNLYSTIIEKQEHNIEFKNEETKKSIRNARECIKKSMMLCGNVLLDFKSMNSVSLKEADFEEVISSGLAMAKIYAKDKKIEFAYKKGENVNVLIDENKFLSVLINLIKNAVENIEEEGNITIESSLEGDYATLKVLNSGKAIPEEIRGKIFEEGFTTKATGSGLGLLICKKTLEEQYGNLSLTKSDDSGTEFKITVLKK